MKWLHALLPAGEIAQAVIILCLVIALGIALGAVKVRGIGLGISCILFAGILFGHYDFEVNHEVLEFVREAGLILFVYCIGLQVGPGFFASLRSQGVGLNVGAAGIVLLGVLVTLLAAWVSGLDHGAAAGLFSGAVTNTPSLAAAGEALRSLPPGGPEATSPSLSYAVAYPFAVAGIIASMALVRAIFRIDPLKETREQERSLAAQAPAIQRRTLRVTNERLEGLPLSQLPGYENIGAVITRVSHSGEIRVAQAGTVLHVGDSVLVVGQEDGVNQLRIIIGEDSAEDLLQTGEALVSRTVIVTKKAVLGLSPREISQRPGSEVTISRVNRGGVELLALPSMRLHFGDSLQVIGPPEAVDAAAKLLGNSVESLHKLHLLPVALGIALGVAIGSWPVEIPGMPAPLRLGLAGGPLLVAILLSRLGHWGPFLFHMPQPANAALRELGIALFLACVGLKAGGKFLETLVSGSGFLWMGWGIAVTLVPLLVVGVVGRQFAKWSYPTLCGVMAGSMTDPPALTFAQGVTKSQIPAISYATVYPLTMILRVIAAQVLVFVLASR
jgi:putative transport protein